MNLYNAADLRYTTITEQYSRGIPDIIRKSKDYDSFDIFLSHSFLDNEIVKGLYIELTNQGFRVYVDWIVDPDLNREYIDRASAERIRRRMASSKSLLLALSTNARLSKWIPWELGYVDGKRNKCALVPISTYQTEEYQHTEYLKLYPRLEKHIHSSFIVDPDTKTSKTLRQFINS